MANTCCFVALMTIALSIAAPKEGRTSTFADWQKSLPGLCVSIELSFGAHSDGGATEARMMRESRAALDKLVPRIAPVLQARLAHYLKRGAAMLASRTIAPCLDEANADNSRHPAFQDAKRWSAPIQLDTLAALLAVSGQPDPMVAGVSSWRGVTVRLRLARATDEALRDKVAADFVIEQFRGGPPTTADDSISAGELEDDDFAKPAQSLFRALAVVAKDRKAAAARKHPVLESLAATLDGARLPATAVSLPPALLVALWSPRETADLATWAARLGERSYFDEDTGAPLLRYLAAIKTRFPALPSAAWWARIAAAKGDLGSYDAILADLMKSRVAIADEDAIITKIYDAWRARPTYDDSENVIRVLTQLGFARRRIAVADALYLQTARLATGTGLPAGYRPEGLLQAVFDVLWRSSQALSPTTVSALVDVALGAKPIADDVLPDVLAALLNIPWSVPKRVALVTKVTAACASCRADARQSISRAAEAERTAIER